MFITVYEKNNLKATSVIMPQYLCDGQFSGVIRPENEAGECPFKGYTVHNVFSFINVTVTLAAFYALTIVLYLADIIQYSMYSVL